MLEEVSKSGYFWTALHFASHYGNIEVLQYLIDNFWDHPDKYDIYNLQTAEGKSPLFWCISSGDISLEVKKQIIDMWLGTKMIDFTLRKKTGEDLLQLAQKNKLSDYITILWLRED